MADCTQIGALRAQVEEMWRLQDVLFNDITAAGAWERKHGPHWTFADVPYHLAYTNRDIVLRPIQLGEGLPAEERLDFSTPGVLDAWNARKFAERPADQTPGESLFQLRTSREELRRYLVTLTDEDLDTPAWMPFPQPGFQTVQAPLSFLLGHDWSEFMQLRIHMGRSVPTPPADVTNLYLGSMFGALPLMLDRDAVDGQTFTAVFAFTDPGVSPLSVCVADGTAVVAPGSTPHADLVLTQSAETWEKTFRGIVPTPEALRSGEVQVNDFQALETFGALFPM
jgi:hypothetical protein